MQGQKWNTSNIANSMGSCMRLSCAHLFANPESPFSTPELSQQLAFMSHPEGKCIAPHRHNKVTREVHYTQEVLVIKKGKLQVDFYTEAEQYIESRVLSAGDVILLCSGAHGFEVLETLEMLEIKQGPYSGEADKTRFPAAPASMKQVKGSVL